MEQIRFYLDEHIPVAIGEGLTSRGIDVLTVQEVGRAGWPDSAQIQFARADGRVLVTMDSDFLVLARRGISHAGIAFAQSHSSIGELIRALLLLFEVLTPEEMRNHVEFL